MGAVNFYYDNKPGIGGEPLPGQRMDPPMSKYPDVHGSRAPAWITFDKQVNTAILLAFMRFKSTLKKLCSHLEWDCTSRNRVAYNFKLPCIIFILMLIRQVLCFEAYFQQAVHESRIEQYRVRRCQVLFYLEDDTIQVMEPRVQNSALPQGLILDV